MCLSARINKLIIMFIEYGLILFVNFLVLITFEHLYIFKHPNKRENCLIILVYVWFIWIYI